jgi:hypothetical protein
VALVGALLLGSCGFQSPVGYDFAERTVASSAPELRAEYLRIAGILMVRLPAFWADLDHLQSQVKLSPERREPGNLVTWENWDVRAMELRRLQEESTALLALVEEGRRSYQLYRNKLQDQGLSVCEEWELEQADAESLELLLGVFTLFPSDDDSGGPPVSCDEGPCSLLEVAAALASAGVTYVGVIALVLCFQGPKNPWTCVGGGVLTGLGLFATIVSGSALIPDCRDRIRGTYDRLCSLLNELLEFAAYLPEEVVSELYWAIDTVCQWADGGGTAVLSIPDTQGN